MHILNAFSVNMIQDFPSRVVFTELTVDQARELAADCKSAVGHADTAAVFAAVLGTAVPADRISIALKVGDRALLGQYRGPRLAEGATTLPEGAEIKWLLVELR